MDWKIGPSKKLSGEITVPADKSISHRSVIVGSVSSGTVRVGNFLTGEDCMRTLDAFRSLGVKIDLEGNSLTLKGNGLRGLEAPMGPIDLGNSGTSMRIIPAVLAGQGFSSTLTGDESLSGRPMGRVIDPLSMMGANVSSSDGKGHAPLEIIGTGKPLKPIDYVSPVASAQVKSCILIAGMYAGGVTSVTEPFQSRDHTERMLQYFSAVIRRKELRTEITGLKELAPRDIDVPGDMSSAAFFIAGALIVKGSSLLLRNVGLNETRTGFLNAVKRMGADINILEYRDAFEPSGNIRVAYSRLRGVLVKKDELPLMIDEIPVFAVIASVADGDTVIEGVGELKVKETDRVKSMVQNLSRMGVDIREEGENLMIKGGRSVLNSAKLKSFGDHRTAMSMAIAALISDSPCIIKDVECADTSYPGFLPDLKKAAY